MDILLLMIGKTDEKYLCDGIALYESRLRHYANVRLLPLNEVRGGHLLGVEELKRREAELIEKELKPTDCVVLLDEHGRQYRSVEFADFLQGRMNAGTRRLVFIIGGAFGFSPTLYSRAQFKLSLSAMTFNHQMVRLFFAEQLYRAFTILRNEKYHNE
ncbi:MAG: 23S rRNA (pseudouridine(1915)-N(3))-methyltransferase RlmH [Bacteroidales bacterium]|nr:23S rRNA (pseudouridine(1915)-N(3))-methyltransferase RlmH [Bacteroidales bacterium]